MADSMHTVVTFRSDDTRDDVDVIKVQGPKLKIL
jgi:hypothetical protein